MKNLEKIITYENIGKAYFILRAALLVFVAVIGFLPFLNGENFYNYMTFSVSDWILWFAPLLFSCIFAFFSKNKPWLAFFAVASALIFYYVYLSIVTGIALGEAISTYLSFDESQLVSGIGSDLLGYTLYVFFADVLFVVYSLVVMIFRKIKSRKIEII